MSKKKITNPVLESNYLVYCRIIRGGTYLKGAKTNTRGNAILKYRVRGFRVCLRRK